MSLRLKNFEVEEVRYTIFQKWSTSGKKIETIDAIIALSARGYGTQKFIGEGDTPIWALFYATGKALKHFFPTLETLKGIDLHQGYSSYEALFTAFDDAISDMMN